MGTAGILDATAPPAVSIEITATSVLSYALAHNRVPVVNRLVLRNDGGPVRGAAVVVAVRDAEGPLATGALQVLAAAQWLATPLPLALEMLAAHVQPNHPAVGELVGEASALLEERTGRGLSGGYADGPERVDQVVAAVCE